MKPTLTQVLIALFLVLGLIEGAFIWLLCEDVMKADRGAKHEFSIVKTTQDLSSTVEKFHKANLNGWWQDSKSVAERPELRRQLGRYLNLSCEELKELGQPPDVIAEMRARISESLVTLNEYQHVAFHGTREQQDEAQIRNFKSTLLCSREFIRLLMRMDKMIHQAPEPPVLGISPVNLLYAAAAVNAIYLLCLVAVIRSLITSPVNKLAVGCDRITQGLPLEKSAMLSAELDSLQENFFLMSKQIAENEQRRKSYISLLQTVQLAVISRVCNSLSEFSRSSTLAEKARKKLDSATTNLSHLVSLLQSMTEALSNRGSQISKLELQKCSTGKLLEEVQASVEALLLSRKIALKFVGDEMQIEIDPALIKRVLLNLVSNAIKYSPDGSTITLTLATEGNSVRFSVQDKGPGISAEGKAKLFQRYSQLSSLDGIKRAGTGLGLVICKELVEAHKGEIGCDSTPGEGSCFWFKLPKSAQASTVKENGITQAARANAKKTAKGGSIILGLASMLLVFLGVQTFLFVQLNSMLNNLNTKSAGYAAAIDKLLTTEELFAKQALWSQQLQLARMTKDVSTAPSSFKLLKKIRSDFSKLYANPASAKEAEESAAILKDEDVLVETMEYGMAHIDEVLAGTDTTESLITKVDLVGRDIEDRFMHLFDLQKEGFNRSYDWSQQLRSQMMTVLWVAAGADVFVILAAIVAGMNVARRINLLKTKALEFADGKAIVPSLKGNDELAYLDKRLCEASAEIKLAEAQRQELMAVINHDLRTPLASVLTVLESLGQGVYGKLEDQGLRIVGESDEELKALLSQINDLLTLEKIDAGSYDMSMQDLTIGEIVNDSKLKVSEEAKEKSVSITVSADDSVLNTGLHGDKELLVRLCSIVLKNAIENSSEGSLLKLHLEKSGNSIKLNVEDCGKGINPDLLPVIFQRFRFIDGKPIAGLGLALAFKVCQMHEGKIAIEKSNSTGTIVEIILPSAA